MTEQEWLKSNDPRKMLEFVEGRISDRKPRLFAVACCRRIWHLLADSRARNAVEASEAYADGHISQEELTRRSNTEGWHVLGDPPMEAANTAACTKNTPSWVAASVARWTTYAMTGEAVENAGAVGAPVAAVVDRVGDEEECQQAELLRHIIGNLFHPYPTPDHWPSTVVQLAQALYNGEDCGFALHDALLEAGHPELANHFKEEQGHPKGCWVVDLILGKE
ncbi:hypothetical protein AYO40_00495 [Planctomycetaceae bacterium SCGC AG-212-D15]|nr:hypothetical protein AYO40_00495 [Planctomycetaceae bacterium SCGC AG-212-D15]